MNGRLWFFYTFTGGFWAVYLVDGFDRKLATAFAWWCASSIVWWSRR